MRNVNGRWQAQSSTIRFSDVSYRYPGADHAAISSVDLEIAMGRFHIVAGRNGSGKSTLARCMNGLLLPADGSVTACGLDTRDDESAMQLSGFVAMIFQDPGSQLVATTVEEEIAFGPENLGLTTAEIRERVDEAIELTGIDKLVYRDPLRLSQGEKQVVAIAGALAMRPRFLVSDESTSMLDFASRGRVMELFERLRDDGMGIVHITHFSEEFLAADELIIMDAGEIRASGAPQSLMSDNTAVREYGLEPLPVPLIVEELRLMGFRMPEGTVTAKGLISWLKS